MMRIQLQGPKEFHSVPWRNGLGTTVEMAREDDADGTMLWRVSTADVVEPVAFSLYPGVDRILTLIEGPGFELDFGGLSRTTSVELLHPVAFSGDWNTTAQAVRGPSRDLNVMTVRGAAAATVHIHRDAVSTAPLSTRSLFFCLGGSPALLLADANCSLAPGLLAVVSGAVGELGTLSGSGTVIQINITVPLDKPGGAMMCCGPLATVKLAPTLVQ